jgi:lambda repressor-like predicted transcriptional regulator
MESIMDVIKWTRADLVKALKVKGYTVAQLAAEVGLTYPATRYSLQTGLSEKVRERVCKILSIPAWRIWPEVYPPQWRESGPPDATSK